MPEAQKRDGQKGRGKRRFVVGRSKSTSPARYIMIGVFCVVGLIMLLVVMSGGSTPASAPAPAPERRQSAKQAPRPVPRPAPVRQPAERAAPRKASRTGRQARARLEFVDAGYEKGSDLRYHRAVCGGCNSSLDERTDTCPKCRAKLTWQDKIACPYCSKDPQVKDVDTTKGFCTFCRGTGRNPNYKKELHKLPFGMTRSESEKCPVCMGSNRCQRCRGSGSYTVPQFFGR